jgi:gliding motility-associated-like protein
MKLFHFFDGSSFDGSNIISWEWNFGNGQFIFSGSDISQTQSYSVSGQYPVILTVTDAIGCVDEYTVTININDPVIWIPNVFTPNGDGVNDVFVLPFDGFISFDILIVNRWGNVMWNQSDQTGIDLWDGSNKGGKKCVDGVYFYKLKGEMYGGTLVDQHGFVTVVQSE